MTKFVLAPSDGMVSIHEGLVHVRGSGSPAAAREVLKFSQGDILQREIASRVILAHVKNPAIDAELRLNEIEYTLGENVALGKFGTYDVPITIYAKKK